MHDPAGLLLPGPRPGSNNPAGCGEYGGPVRNDGIGDGSGEGGPGSGSGSDPGCRESHSDSVAGVDPVSGVPGSGSGPGPEVGGAGGDGNRSASGTGTGGRRIALIGIGLGLVSSISYATVNALLRSVAGEVDPFTGALIRQLPLVGALALLALVLRPRAMRPRAPEFIGPKLALTLLAGGVVSLFVGNALLFWALDWVGLGIATAAYLGGLLLGSALIGRVFLGERPARGELVGIAFIVVGLVVTAVSAQGAAGRGDGAGPGIAVLGFVFAVVTGVCYATSNSLARVSQQVPGRFVVTLSLITLGGVLGLVLFITILHGGKL
ncbi:DMT family transporter, partial [Pseudoclavibacter chungangensis]